jgi:predicted nucleic acid-binding protein
MSVAADRFFVDTNVLLYSIDATDPAKHSRAREWLDALWTNDSGRLSWQVLNEFYWNAVGKMKTPPVRVRENVETLALWQPADFGLGLLHRAWYWSDRRGVAYWDSLILAAAESTGCKYLLSEDFQAGEKFGDLTVLNPFRTAPGEFLLTG